MTLAELEIGQAATVAAVTGTDGLSLRLMEMGLTPSVQVKVIGRAPLGDPIEIEVRSYRLSLRLSEAARVELT